MLFRRRKKWGSGQVYHQFPSLPLAQTLHFSVIDLQEYREPKSEGNWDIARYASLSTN